MQLYDCQVGLQIDDGADSNITNRRSVQVTHTYRAMGKHQEPQVQTNEGTRIYTLESRASKHKTWNEQLSYGYH